MTPQKGSRDGFSAPRAARILVVEDNDAVRRYLIRGLQLDGHSVDQAASGTEAMARFEETVYDLVLTDVNLPGASGLQLFEYCKGRRPQTEVIILTGHPKVRDAVSTVKLGAFDYLEKPVRLDDLRGRIKSALEAHAESVEQGVAGTVADGRRPVSDSYRVVRTLGSGNVGVVLLVEREGQLYAMKVLKPENEQLKNEKLVRRFLREGSIISQLEHPGVVKVFEFGFRHGRQGPYIIMEYVDGLSLADVISEGKTDFADRLKIVHQIAAALSVVHGKGIVHRDIKPSNILVGKDGRAKVTDFGIAYLASSSRLTATLEVLGSPSYMAPESFTGVRDIDHRADIFSLGVLAYELLVGRRPFQATTIPGVINEITSTRPVAPSTIDSDFPLAVQNVLAQMLAKEPGDRYQNTAHIVSELAHIIKGGGLFELRNMRDRYAGKVWR